MKETNGYLLRTLTCALTASWMVAAAPLKAADETPAQKGKEKSDTLVVNHFRHMGPVEVKNPMMVDSVDVTSKAFEAAQWLDQPFSMATAARESRPVEVLPLTEKQLAVNIADFVMETQNYMEAEVKVEGLKHWRLYVDGVKNTDGKVKLEPATHRLTLRYLSLPDTAQQPKVSIISQQANGLVTDNQGRRMFSIHDVVEGVGLSVVGLSPNGKYLIVTHSTRKKGGQSETTRRLIETATGKMLTERQENINWLPRTNSYYYTRAGVDGRQLVAVDPATGQETVMAEQLPEGYFTIAPTEDYLVYSLQREGTADRKDVYEIIHPDDRQPGWRKRGYLARYDLKTGLMQPLTYGYRSCWLQDISADGRYLLFSAATNRMTQRPTTLSSIYRLDLQTMQTDTLVEKDGFVGSALFSPDGKKVVIMGSPESFDGIGKKVKEGQTPSMIDTQLYLMDLSSKQLKPLTRDFYPNVLSMEWSEADGNLYFKAEDRDCVHLFRMDGNTLRIERLQVPEEYVRGFSLAKTAALMAYNGESAANAQRLYTVQTKTMKTKTLRDTFAERFQDVAFGKVEAWDYVNSRGDTICGRYYLPPHFDAGKQYPMLVYYYGGCSPTSRFFSSVYSFHSYAAMGYVVYVVEPSGTTGFGQEFSARHVNTAGDYVADDIIEGTKRFAAEHPFVNPKKIGCLGASYGGFMTQYLQTKTDIFAAAVSHAGISDHTSYWGEGYWGYSYSEVSMANSYPWQNKQLYVDHSPLYNADKIHTPLLFVHGDADHNVPVGESIQMYTALKLLGRETALVLVADQDHHILEYGKTLRWYSTMLAWFAKWLKDDSSWWDAMYDPKRCRY
ncbi:MAG: S9 family peptidase [Prevotella sp.]